MAKASILPTYKDIVEAFEADLTSKLKSLQAGKDTQRLVADIKSMALILEQLTRQFPGETESSQVTTRPDQQIRQQLKKAHFSLSETAGVATRYFGDRESQAEILKDFSRRIDRDVSLLRDIKERLSPKAIS